MGEGLKNEEKGEREPALGIPYYVSSSSATTAAASTAGADGPRQVMAPPYQQHMAYHHQQQYLVHENPYQRGMIPPTAIFDRAPYGIPLRETIFRDTPAPFECPECGAPGLTSVKSKPSLAACVACLVSVVGVCFICPAFDCLWHKEHYCPSCGRKVAEFTKSDPCAVMDATQWSQPSFALPA